MKRILVLALLIAGTLGCDGSANVASQGDIQETPQAKPTGTSDAPPLGATGGFDGSAAYDHVGRLVAIGPRPPGSDGIHAAQTYIIAQLKEFGCQVEQHDFHGSAARGDLGMKDIVAKIPGSTSGIVLYAP